MRREKWFRAIGLRWSDRSSISPLLENGGGRRGDGPRGRTPLPVPSCSANTLGRTELKFEKAQTMNACIRRLSLSLVSLFWPLAGLDNNSVCSDFQILKRPRALMRLEISYYISVMSKGLRYWLSLFVDEYRYSIEYKACLWIKHAIFCPSLVSRVRGIFVAAKVGTWEIKKLED